MQDNVLKCMYLGLNLGRMGLKNIVGRRLKFDS